MSDSKLIIGNYNYSSWSLRGWLAVRMTGMPFECVQLSLDTDQFAERIAEYSSAGMVPVLLHGGNHVWDSLAIIEYLNEQFPQAGLWPEKPSDRAMARSISAEMHSGFSALRTQMPMNCRADGRRVALTLPLAGDIARICQIWRQCRERTPAGGDFLFGTFTAADIMFAPVAMRFHSYGPRLEDDALNYISAIRGHPLVAEWLAAVASDAVIIEHEEVGLIE